MLSEQYFEDLKKSDNKLAVLVKFYSSIFNTNINLYKLFGRLLKVYSPNIVFFSILDCYDIEDFNPNDPYRLLSYFCKKRLESSNHNISYVNLNAFINSFRSKVQKPVRIKNPFEE